MGLLVIAGLGMLLPNGLFLYWLLHDYSTLAVVPRLLALRDAVLEPAALLVAQLAPRNATGLELHRVVAYRLSD